MKQLTLLALASVLCLRASAATSSAQLADALRMLRAVGPEGQGNAAASAAWKDLSVADPKALPTILAGMDGANEFTVNWLRAAVEAIAARELAAGRSLPIAALEKFIQDTRHHPRARRLAYELVERADGPAARRMLAGMLNDPSSELRRDAVQLVIDQATGLRAAGQTNEAVPQYRAALQSARDVDQVEDLAKKLKELGAPVQLPAVFGWISSWKVVGPFDSTGGAGFEKVYPPESGIDLKAEYDGKTGKVRWQEGRARGDYGLVDFNQPLGKLKGVAGYAYTEFSVDRGRPAELRLGCKNAWKIWLNGQFIFGRDEYHRGIEIDQYQLKVDLKPGRNTLLVKLCQNEQVEDWTVEWEFQLRITDSLGTPISLAKTE
jgi:hypothetical protein